MPEHLDEIQIETEGFITTKKGLTLSTISLFIWLLTGIFYKIALLIFTPDYQTFCFCASLFLSILSGLYVTNNLIKTASFNSKLLLIVANILLLYTSANGIQSGYCFLSTPTEKKDIQEMSLIPFLEARPWLPDKFQFTEIKSLQVEKEILKKENRKLVLNNFELSGKIDALVANLSPDEFQRMKIDNFRLQSSLDSLQHKYVSQIVDYENYKTEIAKLKGINSKLVSNINSFNSIQSQWTTQLNNNKNLYRAKNIIVELLGQDFYNTVLVTPISKE